MEICSAQKNVPIFKSFAPILLKLGVGLDHNTEAVTTHHTNTSIVALFQLQSSQPLEQHSSDLNTINLVFIKIY